MMRRAIEARSRGLVLADRATRLCLPLVHTAAGITFAGWLLAGAGPHAALMTAVAVLIVTCPCALGLAIPAVQMVAAGALFRDGVLLGDGSTAFCGAETQAAAALNADPEASVICFRAGEGEPVAFPVRQALRPAAAEVVAALQAGGRRVVILSGDRPSAVASVAGRLGVTEWEAGFTPQDKIARIEALKRSDRRVLMVGDGLNDAPALAAAHASLSPLTAVHVSQAATDGLFLGRSLAPVLSVLGVGARARRLMLQNLWLAAAYNLASVPLAAAGLLTPLIAALAMSGSSVVTLNALRAGHAPVPDLPPLRSDDAEDGPTVLSLAHPSR